MAPTPIAPAKAVQGWLGSFADGAVWRKQLGQGQRIAEKVPNMKISRFFALISLTLL